MIQAVNVCNYVPFSNISSYTGEISGNLLNTWLYWILGTDDRKQMKYQGGRMRKNSLILTLAGLLVCVLFNAGFLFAEEDELPGSGTLSVSGVGGFEGKTVDGVWGGLDGKGDQKAPISGSVSRAGRDKWVMRLFNNSEDKYSVNVEVVQQDEAGKSIKKDRYSYTLSAGESKERSINARANTEQCQLNLTSWKNLSPPKEEEPAEERAS